VSVTPTSLLSDQQESLSPTSPNALSPVSIFLSEALKKNKENKMLVCKSLVYLFVFLGVGITHI
jgi:hypothetical protein